MTASNTKKQSSVGRQLWISQGEDHLIEADKAMAALINRYGPCDLMEKSDFFSVLCESIISQQLSVKAADTIHRRFRSLFEGDAPNPEGLLAIDDDTIRNAGLSKQKVGYLRDLAQKIVSDRVNLHGFRKMENEEIISALTMVKGIGRWTAEMFLIFAMNRSDVLPVDDLGLKKAVQNQYGLQSLPGGGQIRDIARAWHPYATLATWYLWKSRNNK